MRAEEKDQADDENAHGNLVVSPGQRNRPHPIWKSTSPMAIAALDVAVDASWEERWMPEIPPSLAEIEDWIAVARENLRELTEQAATNSGAADEERAAERIADQEEELKSLEQERDRILANRQS
jgi:hypothetical protein